MKLFLLLSFFVLGTSLLPASAWAQPCSNIQVAFTTTESRCIATGTVSVKVTGGSGNYNYMVTGPVSTHYTSSAVISGLQAGTYTLSVKDVVSGCVVEVPQVAVAGSYQDPRFQLSKTDVSCALNDGTITVNGQQFGRAPFSYTIVAPSPSRVGATSTTGHFTHLTAGEYSIQLQDSCGGIQVRKITIENYTWWFENLAVTKVDCNNAKAVIQLKDNKGNTNTSSTAFDGFAYGVVNAPGDTSWFTGGTFQFYLGHKRYATFVAKDACGTVHSQVWNEPANLRPTIGNVQVANFICSGFDASISGGQNLTTPTYALYNSTTGQLVGSNATGAFTNLPYGAYCMNIIDNCYDTTIVRCFSMNPPAISLAATPIISNQTCATFTATITGSNLSSPSYCLYDAQEALVACNTTGVFEGLPYGSYCVRVTDGCTGEVLENCFTGTRPLAVLTGYSLSGQSCRSFNVSVSGSNLINPQYCLFDSDGNVVMCNNTGIFEGIANGSYCIRAISCGDTTNAQCFSSGAPEPYMGTAVTYNKTCSTFTVGLTGTTNISNAIYRLYDANESLVTANSTGTFENLPYGKYCIRVTDGCNNQTLSRCVTESRPVPSVNANIGQINSSCSTFTARVEGQQNLTDPLYHLLDADKNLITKNTTGLFPNLPYGTYFIDIRNFCYDTVIRLQKTFTFNYSMGVTAAKSCTFGSTDVRVSFTNGVAPYAVKVYGPDGQLVRTATTSSSSLTVTLPALAAGQQYTVEGTDNCGRTATQTVTPNATLVTKAIVAQSKCPSSTWQNGSGNLVVSYTSNHNSITPTIIKKDGVAFSRSHSSQSGNSFTFSDLEPATYIIEYAMRNCTGRLYDTFALQPYTYPSQGLSAVYQCDNNSFSLGADVKGGVGPYTYQIIGSVPQTPSIISDVQTSPIFNIDTKTEYSLVRLRSVDACGNATLNDVSVLPLQNIVMKASRDCFFSDVTLSVDTIPNATYQWYKKRSATDSVLLTTNVTFNLPFMQPEDVGTYVCKVTVNEGCITRLSSYTLDGDCGHTTLPASLQLTGTATEKGNVLRWQATDKTVIAYTVERKGAHDNSFAAMTTINAQKEKQSYTYTDAAPLPASQYRVQWTTAGGKKGYSNMVRLQGPSTATVVYPNPVTSELNIAFSGGSPATYRIQLYNAAGQTAYKTELKNVTSTLFRYQRSGQVKAGMYLLKIVNVTSGTTSDHKLLFK